MVFRGVMMPVVCPVHRPYATICTVVVALASHGRSLPVLVMEQGGGRQNSARVIPRCHSSRSHRGVNATYSFGLGLVWQLSLSVWAWSGGRRFPVMGVRRAQSHLRWLGRVGAPLQGQETRGSYVLWIGSIQPRCGG